MFWAISLSCFAKTETLTWWKRLTADHQYVDFKLVGIRRLITLSLKIPPGYLTVNQRKSIWADHILHKPFPHLDFKSSSLKAIEEFWVFWAQTVRSPFLAHVGHLAMKDVLKRMNLEPVIQSEISQKEKKKIVY